MPLKKSEKTRRLAAIMFTDIVGYTALMQQDEKAAAAIKSHHREEFQKFVNSYRLEAFKSKAAAPSQQHLTLLALACDSGFNSKTVFNTFFKKMMGKTPKAYWKEVVK